MAMKINIKELFKNDFTVAFTIAFLWQITMTVIGYLLLPDPANSSPLHHTTLWDGNWYLGIIESQYRGGPAAPAFYPLFPTIIGSIHFITFGIFGYAVIGLFVNTIALMFMIAGLLKIAREFDLHERARFLPITFLLLAPSAFFLHQFYGEAVFTALGTWAYLFALQRKWLAMGILLAFLTASRLPSLLIVGLCLLEYVRSYDWSVKKAINSRIFSFILAPLGFIAYGIYLQVVRNDFFAMFHAYGSTKDWIYHKFDPNFIMTIGEEVHRVILALAGVIRINSDLLVGSAIPLFMLITLFGCSLYLILKTKGKSIPLGIFGLVSIIFFTLNSNVISVHRYTLPCLTIYIALSLLYVNHRKLRPLLIGFGVVTISIQVLLVVFLYTSDKFVG